MFIFPISLQKDGDTFLATSPDFPELTTFGADRDDALRHAIDALEEAIAARIAAREPIPVPSARGKWRVALPTQTAMKVLVYQSMAEAGLRKAGLAKRLSWHMPQVDRLLDIRHATRTDQIDVALAAMGKRLVLDLEND